MLTEIRWHGRAGQGVITVSRLLAYSGLIEGKYVQAFPEFGPERLGAPMSGFTRISDEPIDVHSQIYEPNFVVVLDSSLLKTVDVKRGLLPDGEMLLNTSADPESFSAKLAMDPSKIHVVDATKIALSVLGRAIVNTVMLGAVAKIAQVVSISSIEKALRERFEEALAEKNIELVKRAYVAVR